MNTHKKIKFYKSLYIHFLKYKIYVIKNNIITSHIQNQMIAICFTFTKFKKVYM